MELYFVRHGRSFSNKGKYISDNPKTAKGLDLKGKIQAKLVARKLKNKDFGAIFSSQLLRTKQTAEAINKYHNLNIKLDKRINERKTNFDGKKEKEYKEFIAKDPLNIHLPNAESYLIGKKRVVKFINSIKKLPHKTILAVGHDDTLKVANGYFNKLSDKKAYSIKFKNCQIIHFKI